MESKAPALSASTASSTLAHAVSKIRQQAPAAAAHVEHGEPLPDAQTVQGVDQAAPPEQVLLGEAGLVVGEITKGGEHHAESPTKFFSACKALAPLGLVESSP